MASQKTQKIDFNAEYPCPCPRRRGRLIPITLTEAMGCDRCQQIFVVEEGGYVLEQLSTTYPYKRAWRWTGYRWNTAYSNLGESYLPLALCIVFILLLVWLPLALAAGGNTVLWALPSVLLVVLPALLVWWRYRR